MSRTGTCQRCKAPLIIDWLILKTEEKETKLELCMVCMEQARAVWSNFMSPKKREEGEDLTDESIMYFGKYKDKVLKIVPAQYLLWCGDQKWIGVHGKLKAYIEKNRAALEEEVSEKGGAY